MTGMNNRWRFQTGNAGTGGRRGTAGIGRIPQNWKALLAVLDRSQVICKMHHINSPNPFSKSNIIPPVFGVFVIFRVAEWLLLDVFFFGWHFDTLEGRWGGGGLQKGFPVLGGNG